MTMSICTEVVGTEHMELPQGIGNKVVVMILLMLSWYFMMILLCLNAWVCEFAIFYESVKIFPIFRVLLNFCEYYAVTQNDKDLLFLCGCVFLTNKKLASSYKAADFLPWVDILLYCLNLEINMIANGSRAKPFSGFYHSRCDEITSYCTGQY